MEELREHLGPSAEMMIGNLEAIGRDDRHRQMMMIANLIRLKHNRDIGELESLERDIDRSDFDEHSKDLLYVALRYVKDDIRRLGEAPPPNVHRYLQQREVGGPTKPESPAMRFTRSIIFGGVENAMRYLSR